MATCRSCDAPIVWARTRAGKMIPLDAKEVETAGVFTLESIEGTDEWRIREAPPLFRTHFATCPNANAHRRARTAT